MAKAVATSKTTEAEDEAQEVWARARAAEDALEEEGEASSKTCKAMSSLTELLWCKSRLLILHIDRWLRNSLPVHSYTING